MAITKSFVEHTMLKAQDLNDLVAQANGYVHEVDVKKPDTVDISQYLSENDELPLGCYYVYYGNPTHTLAGRYTYTDTYFIAICISHWDHAHTLAVYTKNAQNKYIYYETFRTDQASTAMERYIASLFTEPPVTYEQDGLMTHEDKQLFDDIFGQRLYILAAFVWNKRRKFQHQCCRAADLFHVRMIFGRKSCDTALYEFDRRLDTVHRAVEQHGEVLCIACAVAMGMRQDDRIDIEDEILLQIGFDRGTVHGRAGVDQDSLVLIGDAVAFVCFCSYAEELVLGIAGNKHVRMTFLIRCGAEPAVSRSILPVS